MSSPSPKKCYYPNGDESSDTPCNESADVSACCGSSSYCLNNSYCVSINSDSPMRFTRGSCTSRDWSSTVCPSLCSDVNPTGWTWLAYVDTSLTKDYYCCMHFNTTTATCETRTSASTDPFTLPRGHLILDRATGSTTVPSANTSSPSATPQRSDHDTIGVALSVGISLGVTLYLICAAFIILWIKYRRLKRRLVEQKEPSPHLLAAQWENQPAARSGELDRFQVVQLAELAGDRTSK